MTSEDYSEFLERQGYLSFLSYVTKSSQFYVSFGKQPQFYDFKLSLQPSSDLNYTLLKMQFLFRILKDKIFQDWDWFMIPIFSPQYPQSPTL